MDFSESGESINQDSMYMHAQEVQSFNLKKTYFSSCKARLVIGNRNIRRRILKLILSFDVEIKRNLEKKRL